MGLPRYRPPGWGTRLLRRIVSPTFYLKLVVGIGVFGLFILPTLADLINATIRPVQSAEGSCRILRVIDGDTLSLICPEEGIHSARLLGYDTPEKFSPKCLSELVAAERATWALRTFILKAKRLKIKREGIDRYGRALVVLTLDGLDVARAMIRAGHAKPYEGGLRGGWCA